MQTDKFNELINGVKEKLGEEATALISDDLAILISDNAQTNKDLENRDTQINTLKQDKENLIKTNGNLLQQVSVGKEEDFSLNQNKQKEKEEKKEPFSFKKQFDEKGNFIE